MITGHFWYATKNCLDSNRYNITLLRDPADRVLSMYYFYRNMVDNSSETTVNLAKNLNLHDFLSCGDVEILENVKNYMTIHFARMSTKDLTQDSNHILELAKKNISEFDFIGIYENLIDSIDMLCYELGWPSIRDIPHVNLTRNRERLDSIDKKTRDKLYELNQLDFQLYEFAKKRFFERKRNFILECIERKHAGNDFISSKTESQEPVKPQASPAPSPVYSESSYGNLEAEILGVSVLGKNSNSPTINSGEEAVITILVRANKDIDNITVGILIKNELAEEVFGTNSHHLRHKFTVFAGKEYEIKFHLRMDLGQGTYYLDTALHSGSSHLNQCYHRRDNVVRFDISGNYGDFFIGLVKLYPKLESKTEEDGDRS